MVGDLDDDATLLHLVLRDDGTGAGREIVLAANSVDARSKRIVEGNVTYFGDTKYDYFELRLNRTGDDQSVW